MAEEYQRVATCACNAISLRISGAPIRVSICHCFACQKRTGAPFAQQARFLQGDIEVAGSTQVYTRTADSGNRIDFHFCSRCATVMYYIVEPMLDHVAVPVGLLCDPNFPAPDFSVYEERMHHWIQLPAAMEHLH